MFIKNKAFIASSITKRWRVKWPVSFAAISYWPSHFSAVASSRVVRAYRHPIRNVSGTSKAHLPGDYSHANASAPAPDHRRGEADPRRSPRSIFGEPSIAPPSPAAGTVATVPTLLLTTLRLKLHRLHLELHCPCNLSNLKSRCPGGLHDRVCDVRELIDRIRRPGNQPCGWMYAGSRLKQIVLKTWSQMTWSSRDYEDVAKATMIFYHRFLRAQVKVLRSCDKVKRFMSSAFNVSYGRSAGGFIIISRTSAI